MESSTSDAKPIVTWVGYYPVKSGGAVSFGKDEVHVDERGLAAHPARDPYGFACDRRFAVIGKNRDTFAWEKRTQRDPGFEKLALVQPSVAGEYLFLTTKGMRRIRIPLRKGHAGILSIDIWGDAADCAILESAHVERDDGSWEPMQCSEWLRALLLLHSNVRNTPEANIAKEARLVRQEGKRLLSKRAHTPPTTEASLADGAHVLMIAQEWVEELNVILRANGLPEVTMDQFRPNIVTRGGDLALNQPLGRIRLGSAELLDVRGCTRCSMVNVLQETGERIANGPLKVIVQQFQQIFGRYLLVAKPGYFYVGDTLKRIDTTSQ
ncbi:MAG: MOSC domain-containing protein [Candidatus Peregrinibacteria bacterium]|nr:MOSC domain-containing protein [Candidatus Peregrinibacteria bacterium]